MCLGSWSQLGLVKNKDIFVVTTLAEIKGDEEALGRVGMPFNIFALWSDTLHLLPCTCEL
jgi:hypothetical protein